MCSSSGPGRCLMSLALKGCLKNAMHLWPGDGVQVGSPNIHVKSPGPGLLQAGRALREGLVGQAGRARALPGRCVRLLHVCLQQPQQRHMQLAQQPAAMQEACQLECLIGNWQTGI